MFKWNEDNVKWMESAAEYSGYYEELGRIIQPFLKKDDHICEIGCGLGHLSCAMSPLVKQVTAVDISELAIERVRIQASIKNVENLTLINTDWTQMKNSGGPSFDVVLLSYISAIRDHWTELKELTNGLVIAVLANGESGTGLQSSLYNPIYEDIEGRDTIINVIPFLEKQGISYQLLECELEYGQPLEDMEEAHRFVSRYYKGTENELKAYLEQKLRPTPKGYYLPKTKKSGILIIDGKKKG